MWCQENKIVNGLYFKQTCVISPEQYDVFLNEKYVAYVRCRYRHLTVCPILKDVIIPNVINITDHDYCNIMDSHDKIESCIDFDHPFYEKYYEDENEYRSNIDKEDFDIIANEIYEHLKRSLN